MQETATSITLFSELILTGDKLMCFLSQFPQSDLGHSQILRKHGNSGREIVYISILSGYPDSKQQIPTCLTTAL